MGASAGEDAFARLAPAAYVFPARTADAFRGVPSEGASNEGDGAEAGAEASAEANASAGAGADANASAGPSAKVWPAPRSATRSGGIPAVESSRRVLLDPTLQGGASEAVPAGELDVVSGLRSRRWAPTRGESGKEFRASLFGVAFDLANHAGLFLGGESVIEVAGGFRGGGPRGTLHRGSLGVAVVVVVARFRVHLRVDEFLEGKILVVLDLGGASERVSSRAIRPVAEGRSRPLLAVRRSVRGDEENMSRSTSTRASAQVAARSAARSVANATKADVRVAVMGFGACGSGATEK